MVKNKKTILVLGGTGFIGKNLIRTLSARKDRRIISASKSTGLDLLDLKQVRKYFGKVKPDVIINCAAHTGSLHYVTAKSADVLNDNVAMTLNIYNAVRSECPDAKIINPLSNCSYPGDANIHFEPDWFNGHVHDSVYSYGNAKRFIYIISRCYQKQYGIKTVNFLLPNTFGPGDHADANKVHALNGMIIRMIKADKEKAPAFEIWGTGKPIREWAYVDDVINILKAGIDTQHDLIYPVNMGQNRGYSIKQSAKLIAQALGYKGKLVFNTKYQDGAPIKILDNKKFKKMFPKFRFTDHKKGIKNTVEYYKSILT